MLRVYTTSSAVSGLPSWNFTPWRIFKSRELSSAKRHSVASEGLISKVAGSRCTSMSQAWCARISPVRWLLKYMSTLGTASTNWMRSVSEAFWALADGATASEVAARRAERRVIFTKTSWNSRKRRLSSYDEASLVPQEEKRHDSQTDRQGTQRRARHAQGLGGSGGPRRHPEKIPVRRLHPGLGIHDPGGAGRREGRPPP